MSKIAHFDNLEYTLRLSRTKQAMDAAGIELMICTDPANMDYLTGYKGWSFYVPQAVLVHLDEEHPVWIGRGQDAAAARLTTTLPHENIIAYPDDYVQNREKHPMDFMADFIRAMGWGSCFTGLEMDAYYFSARAADSLRTGLPGARFQDSHHLVNWVRIVKSEAELRYIREAARIVEATMRETIDMIDVGVPQYEVVADIYHAQIAGVEGMSGDYTAICPLLPTGVGTSTPHLTWSEDLFQEGEATIIELAGARRRYHCPMARTVHLGQPLPLPHGPHRAPGPAA